MSRKNDKIIVSGMIAVGVLAMASVVAILGLGTYVYTNEEKPTPMPTQAPMPTPVTTPVPQTADLKDTFDITKVLSDEAGRTYTLYIMLTPDAAPVDMSRLTVQVLADGKKYNVWDFRHGEHSATGNSDVILDQGETFALTVYLPQADVPLLDKGEMMQIDLLLNGQTASSLDLPAV